MRRLTRSRTWSARASAQRICSGPAAGLKGPPLTFVCGAEAPGSPRPWRHQTKQIRATPRGPDEVAGDEGSKPQEGGRDRQAEENAPDNEDGTATGNPNAAG
jgi:hypothetical protein